MLNRIIDGISLKISETFGNSYKIYTEDVEQGLKEPCFFIFCVNPTSTQVLNRRYRRNNLFCIQYFPSTAEPNTECYDVADSLMLTLEYIMVDGDLTRGTKMHSEIVDGILHFFINYDVYVYKAVDMEVMEQLEIPGIKTKG